MTSLSLLVGTTVYVSTMDCFSSQMSNSSDRNKTEIINNFVVSIIIKVEIKIFFCYFGMSYLLV